MQVQTLAQLKQFCTENAIVVEGDRRLRATWEKAVEAFQSAQDAAAIAVESAIYSDIPQRAVEVGQAIAEVVQIGWATATSDEAKRLYRNGAIALFEFLMVCAYIFVSACEWAVESGRIVREGYDDTIPGIQEMSAEVLEEMAIERRTIAAWLPEVVFAWSWLQLGVKPEEVPNPGIDARI